MSNLPLKSKDIRNDSILEQDHEQSSFLSTASEDDNVQEQEVDHHP